MYAYPLLSCNGCEFSVDDQQKTDLGKIKSAHDGSCWRHVHPEEMNVIDLDEANFTSYTIAGSVATITTSTEVFESEAPNRFIAGKYGDHLEIDSSLQAPFDDPAIQNDYKTLEYNPSGNFVLMCGSPSEVGSDPFHGDRGFDIVLPEFSAWRVEDIWELAGQKHTIWTHTALNAPDQLRMKMAWDLSQIVSVGLPNAKVSVFSCVNIVRSLIIPQAQTDLSIHLFSKKGRA